MANEYGTCEICDKKTVDLSDPHEYHEDDSGLYHEECHQTRLQEEMNYYGRMFANETFNKAIDYDPSDAYEWGDPKNPAYVEWLYDEADRLRKDGK